MTWSEGWGLTLLVVIGFILLCVRRRGTPWLPDKVHFKPPSRPLKPRTPDDCLACRAAQLIRQPSALLLIPYARTKNPRGRKKRIATARYACPNSNCLYYGITDEQIHALVGCGGHGRQEYIQDLKCQACRTTPALAGGAREFSVRYGTALYRLKTPSRRVGEVLSALAEGLSVGAAVRVFGHSEFTIRTRFASRAPDCTQPHGTGGYSRA
jgi:hypothetical protein